MDTFDFFLSSTLYIQTVTNIYWFYHLNIVAPLSIALFEPIIISCLGKESITFQLVTILL